MDQLLAAFPEWRALVSQESVLAQLATLFSTFIGEESILRARDDHVPWLDVLAAHEIRHAVGEVYIDQ